LAGFTPRIAHRADEASFIQRLAEAGLGAGLLPALARSGPYCVRYARAVPEPPRRHVWALVRQGAAGRPAVTAALEELRRVAGAAAQAATARRPTPVIEGPSPSPR
jgi:DNA-binding transcriptional LysR family regulator